MPRGANFSREELDSFLDIVEDILPLSTTQWESVVETHSGRYPDKGRTVDSLKRKFKELHIKRIPTGDPHCLPAVRRAKQLRNAIIKLMDGCDLNSPDITPHWRYLTYESIVIIDEFRFPFLFYEKMKKMVIMYRAVQRTVHSCREETRLAVFSVPFPPKNIPNVFLPGLKRL